MNYLAWVVCLEQHMATHESGYEIRFEGVPGTDYFGGVPTRIPENLDTLDTVRLLRYGYEAYSKAYLERPDPGNSKRASAPASAPVIIRRKRRLVGAG